MNRRDFIRITTGVTALVTTGVLTLGATPAPLKQPGVPKAKQKPFLGALIDHEPIPGTNKTVVVTLDRFEDVHAEIVTDFDISQQVSTEFMFRRSEDVTLIHNGMWIRDGDLKVPAHVVIFNGAGVFVGLDQPSGRWYRTSRISFNTHRLLAVNPERFVAYKRTDDRWGSPLGGHGVTFSGHQSSPPRYVNVEWFRDSVTGLKYVTNDIRTDINNQWRWDHKLPRPQPLPTGTDIHATPDIRILTS